MPKLPSSERRLAANRANAQKSTGPKTSEGKARSSLNALKTGLTGHTVLLPSDDVAAYREHLKRLQAAFAPVGVLEEQLVHTLADLQWRLNRLTSLESGYLALARRRLDPALLTDEPDPAIRAVLLEAHAQEAAAKSLEALHRQEQRLRRQYAGENKELQRLQTERREAARQHEERQMLQETFALIRDCSCESCREFLTLLWDRLAPTGGRTRQVASNSPRAKDTGSAPPQIIIRMDPPPTPTNA